MQLPLNVSPVSASFFGIQHLGIHLVLCVACSLICSVSSVIVFLCFNSCSKSLSKIEDSSYSVVHVPLSGDNLRVPNNSRVENSLFVFIVRVSDRPGIEPFGSSSLERR